MTIIEHVQILHFYPGSVSGPQDIAIDGTRIVEVGTALAAKYPKA